MHFWAYGLGRKLLLGGFVLEAMIGRKAWDFSIRRREESNLLEDDHEDHRK